MGAVVGLAPPFLPPAAGEPILPLEDVTEQVWAAERRKSGKRPWQFIEVELDRCTRTFGQAPCTASGAGPTKCYNSWETCQDPPNFLAEPFWLRLGEAVADMPRTLAFEESGLAAVVPLLRGISHSPTMPDPGETLGLRVQLTASLEDAPHHDRGIDKYISEREAYLLLPGAIGNYASTPDSALNSITGDIDIRLKVAADDWTPSGLKDLLDKSDSDFSEFSYFVRLEPSGALTIYWSEDGSTLRSGSSTAAIGASDGSTTWVRVTLDVDNGAAGRDIKFYTSDDGVTWSQLGATLTQAGVTSIHDGTASLKLGKRGNTTSDMFSGKIYYAEIRNGIDGTVVAKFDPTRFQPGATYAVSDTGEAWSIIQSGAREAEVVAFNAIARSTLLRKMRKRFPHYIGRRMRWYQGYITEAPSLADFRRREYIMERFDGPDDNGRVRIVAKDPLKLLDDDRAQAPRKSRGTLVAALAAASSPATLDVATTDLTEYDLKAGESVDYVRIGEEVIRYTGTSVVNGNVRLSGLTYSAPSPYTTQRKDHDAGDEVQRCRYFSGTVPQVLRELMVDYGGIDAGFIPYEDWTLEADTWIAGDNVQRLVTEPEGVKTLIEEVIQQTLTFAIWFDEIEQKIRFRALRPADYTDVVAQLTDDANLVADSVSVTDMPDKIVNEVQFLYGQIDPTQGTDEVGNYRKGLVLADADSQSGNETGSRRIRRYFGTWHPAANQAVVERKAQRTLTARSRNLMEVQFKLERRDEDLRTGDFADLTTLYLIDAFGVPREARVQVLRVDASGELVSYKAREDFFSERLYGRWAPEELTGLSWANATDEQRLRYLFWADADERFTNGDEGKIWL